MHPNALQRNHPYKRKCVLLAIPLPGKVLEKSPIDTQVGRLFEFLGRKIAHKPAPKPWFKTNQVDDIVLMCIAAPYVIEDNEVEFKHITSSQKLGRHASHQVGSVLKSVGRVSFGSKKFRSKIFLLIFPLNWIILRK